jgi:hypothetical protein
VAGFVGLVELYNTNTLPGGTGCADAPVAATSHKAQTKISCFSFNMVLSFRPNATAHLARQLTTGPGGNNPGFSR